MHGAWQGCAAQLEVGLVCECVGTDTAPMAVMKHKAARVHDPLVPAQLFEGDVERGPMAVGMNGGII